MHPRRHALVVLTLAACVREIGEGATPCDLHAVAADLAGPDAIDCGAVAQDADGTAGWQCAVDAFQAADAYLLLVARHGIDSNVTQALVSDGARTWLLQNDDQGGNHDVDGWDCVDPVVDDPRSDDRISCTALAPEGNHYQVCGLICDSCGSPAPLPFDP